MAGFSHRRTWVAALFVALTVGLAAHLLHVGHHAGHVPGLGSGLSHWLRDSVLAVPIAALVVRAVDRFALARASTRRVLARLRWGVITGLGYSMALVPGGLAHGRLFPSEAHTGDALRHALADAVALLPVSVYTAVAVAVVLGMPFESAAPVTVALRRLRDHEWGTVRWRPTRLGFGRSAVALAAFLTVLPAPALAGPDVATQLRVPTFPALTEHAGCRTVTADVVALDQPFYYNRLGAIQANGMMYALARDVVVQDNPALDPDVSAFNGMSLVQFDQAGGSRADLPGQVTLRPDKRPRPLTLRANEGDCLEIDFTNLLSPVEFTFNLPADFPTGQILGLGVPIPQQVNDQPLTRQASIHIDGLYLVGDIGSDGSNVGKNTPGSLVDPGESTTYTYKAEHEATHLMYSMGATIGGDGGGGARTYGLFGAVNIQKQGAEWYRSQLTRQEMDWAASAWMLDNGVPTSQPSTGNEPQFGPDGLVVRTTPDGHPVLNYDAVYPAEAGPAKAGLPIIDMLDGSELVHGDLNAIITGPGRGRFDQTGMTAYEENLASGDRNEPYREFTVIFHDDAFGVQAFPGFYNDPVLKHTLAGVTDSFPINYGSGGIGSEIIANRLGVGPMWDCAECKYEEFFLTSFTVGDPAMIVDIPANTTDATGNIISGAKATKALYPDDPSNVHHAYLNDRVKFRNLHAGPKEHHIFHLHAHQWLFNPDDPQSNYLDGQALGPGAAYTYEIAYGGSGNRNKTVGDSIFHCHFYPHFAQGMWELWRVHDTFEQGTLMDIDPVDGLPIPAAGSRALPDGEIVAGTPIPGVVPIPTNPMAPMPDPAATIVASDLNGDGIADSSQFDANGDGFADYEQVADPDAEPATNPGYPWFTPGVVGHRPPTPALDLVDVDEDGVIDDGGLPRHVVVSGPDEDNLAHAGDPVEMYVSRLDFNKVLHEASAIEIPEEGTPAERVAMKFHEGEAPGDPTWDTYYPDGRPVNDASTDGTTGFEVNGLPARAGAPFADPCRAFSGAGPWTNDYPDGTVRTIKGANIEMPIVLNKVGWHFQQQRFEALWEDVVPTLTNAKAPEPMIMRLNSTDCAEFWHTNLVPNVYQLDDYQVRTPTDIIGQHIHLVKFDVMSADGSANGWNYEDGTLSPDEVRERIEAFNNGGGLKQEDGTVTTALTPQPHPYFGATGPNGQDWLGARTTIQRWYADPLLERSWDGGVGTVFTHDHYGPSTHQQVGLYSTLLVEPEGSVWRHNETGQRLGTRPDGGPTTWQAIIEPGGGPGDAEFDAHREFYFEFADFQHAYEARTGAEITQLNENLLGPSVNIPSYADFGGAINPSFRLPPANPADIYVHPNWCPGTTFDPLTGAPLTVIERPCPEAISADDPGTYALNFRNEPIGLRVFNGQQGAAAGQTPGLAGNLAFAYQSRTDRAIAALNGQPAGPYPPLTADVQPGDPWTPMLRVYMGDQVRIRVQVGAHEEEHNFTIPGLKWRKEPNSPNSGWRNSEFFGIDEYFNLDVPIIPDSQKTGGTVDYIYTVGAELEGMWNGVWGIMRSYTGERNDLYELPTNDVGRGGYDIVNQAEFDGICPVTAPGAAFDVTAVRAVDVLDPVQGLVYNDRLTTLRALPGGITGEGPLIDPTATIYVLDEDLTYDPTTGAPNGLKPGAPVEPLILRVNAGDCVTVNLTNALPADLAETEMPGWNSMPPIVQKDENIAVPGVGGILTFNANDITPSSYVGLTPQLLAFDPKTNGGFSTGLTTGKLVAPGATDSYTWYAGDISVTNDGLKRNRTQFTLNATPVEFGATGLMPADRIKGSENGMVGALIVEPQHSCWTADPGTRAQATVWKGELGLRGECAPDHPITDGFRDFVTVVQNDVNLRYGGTVQVLDAGGLVAETIDCGDPSQMRRMECAVPNIAAEGPLGPTEESQDSGQKAINYGADPMWFRLGVVPDFFQILHRDTALKDLVPNVFSNFLDIGDGLGEVGEPQTVVFRASPNGPQYGRMRVVMPGGHARGISYTLHGHQWQGQPYISGSTEIGDRSRDAGADADSGYYGVQEGINPTGHWDFLVDLGGPYDVTGDYLWRDQAAFGSFQGLWGLLRFDNTAPVAVDAVAEVPKYGQVDIPLGFDLDGDQMTVEVPVIPAVGAPTFGTATDIGNGAVTYVSTAWPDCGDPFACTDTFTYTVRDDQGNVSGTGVVTVTVTNTAPLANNDTVQIDAAGAVDVAVPVLANDVDAEGDLARDTLTVQITADPLDQNGVPAGTATLSPDNTIRYVNDAPGFEGVVRFRYTIEDESGAVSNEGVVRVAIRVDSIVITTARFQEVNGKWTVAGTCSVPGNTITLYSGDSIETPWPTVGTAVCEPDNTFLFSATSDAPDPDPTAFNYVSAESTGLGFHEGFPLTFAGPNNPPVAVNDSAAIPEDTATIIAVLANDTDADFDPLVPVVVSQPAHGTVAVMDPLDGLVSYTPDANWFGIDTFTYQADDGQDLSNVATVTVTVSAVNDAPNAVDDLYVMAPGGNLNVGAPDGVLANDSDVEGDTFTLYTTPVSGPAAGNDLTLNADGSLIYTPATAFAGTDTFQYRICEDLGGPNELCGTATVTINVGVNTAPVAVDDTYQTEQNSDLSVAAPGVLGSDTDPDGDPLTVATVNGAGPNVDIDGDGIPDIFQFTLPSGATLTLDPDGSFVYSPLFNFLGTDSFIYVADDGTADSNEATVTITVIDRVTITTAEYRTRQTRWNVQGTVSAPTSTVTLYTNTVEAGNVLGIANVDPISGSWSFNSRTAPAPTGGDVVIAVSSGGGVSAPRTVNVRR